MTDDLTPEAVELELEAVLPAQLVPEKVTGSAEGVAHHDRKAGWPECQTPTCRQLEVLRAYIAAGSIAAAAYELGISETTARQHLSGLYRRTGSVNAAQPAYLLGIGERSSPRSAQGDLLRGDRLPEAWRGLPSGSVDPSLEHR
jgi:DNA-binding NarL/FixJ family response regulator